MRRFLAPRPTAVAAGLAVVACLTWTPPAAAQTTYTWNGPFTGTTAWSAGTWSPAVPPVGGGSGTTLVFTQLGSGAAAQTYTANNDRGNFQLSTLTFASAGGNFVVGNAAGNTLEIVGTGSIQQNGLGVQTLSANTTLTAANTTVSGSGAGNLQISGVLSGPGAVIIDRPQTLAYTGLTDLTGANTFTGGVTLHSGNLRVGNATALGTGTLTIEGGTLGATAATTVGNAVNLKADLVYSGFGNLTLTSAVTETGGPRQVVVSTATGNVLTLQGANTYTGATVVQINPLPAANEPVVGGLAFSGVNGSALNSPSFTINGGGFLFLDNTAGNNNNRIADAAPVTIAGGAFLLSGGQGTTTLERVGTLSGVGNAFVVVSASATGNTGTTLQASSLVRVNNGQFVFLGSTGFGGTPGPGVANLILDTAPALVGGGGAAGTTTVSIIPYAIGGTTDGNGTDLVTYGANGVRPLATSEYATTITSGTTTATNVKLAAATAVTADTTVNALVLATATPFTGSTARLTVTSGTVVVPDLSPVIPTAMKLDFGAAEGQVFTPFTNDPPPRLVIDGVLAGTGGLTKTGDGSVVLNNVANTITGALTINGGLVEFPDPAALAGFSDIRVNGTAVALTTPPGLALNVGSATLNKPIAINGGFVHLIADNGTLTLAGPITGSGGLFINGGTIELTNPANSYTGQTRVFLGTLVVGSDAVLGNGGGVDIGSEIGTGVPPGLLLSGNWTTNRQINFSFASQVDTNGFTWTVNSGLTGDAATIEKAGAGAWVLTQGGSLGQSLVTGIGTTTTTVNVLAGELRVTNPTGSATGTAAVNIGTATAAATLTGTGRIAGVTTIAAAGVLSPGTGGNAGTLTFDGALTINGTFRGDTTGDTLVVAGALALGAASALDLTGSAFNPATTYTLATYASRTGTFATTTGVPLTHTLFYGATSITLAPVPEPATVLGVAAAALGAGAVVRRRVIGGRAAATA